MKTSRLLFLCLLTVVVAVEALTKSGYVSVTPASSAQPLGHKNGWGLQKGGVLSATVRIASIDESTRESLADGSLFSKDFGCAGGVVGNHSEASNETRAPADLAGITTPMVLLAAIVFRKDQWIDAQSTALAEEASSTFADDGSNTTSIFSPICALPSLAFSPITPNGNQKEVVYNVTYDDQLVLVVALCHRNVSSFLVGYNVSYINPGGNEASLENIAIAVVSFGFTLVFFGIFLGWLAYLVFTQYHGRGVFGLQLALLLSIFCKAIESIVVALVQDQSKAIPKILATLSEAWFLVVQFLMCIGWTVNTKEIPMREKNVTWLLTVVLTIVGIVVAACGDEADGKCSSGSRSAASLVYGATRVIFLMFNGWTLNTNLESLRRALETADDPLATKHFLRYRAVRFPYCVSLPMPLFVYFLEAAVLSWRGAFVSALISHLTTVYVFLCIMIYFRSGLIIF